jgi:hypothetical protein
MLTVLFLDNYSSIVVFFLAESSFLPLMLHLLDFTLVLLPQLISHLAHLGS